MTFNPRSYWVSKLAKDLDVWIGFSLHVGMVLANSGSEAMMFESSGQALLMFGFAMVSIKSYSGFGHLAFDFAITSFNRTSLAH
jgi:hypothetical protein